MKLFYVVDPSGTIKSSDGTKTYKALRGRALREYLLSEEGKKKHFYMWKDEAENTFGIEVSYKVYCERKKEINRENYLAKLQETLDISFLSIENMVTEDDELNGEELLADDSQDTEGDLMEKVEKELLCKILDSLSAEERFIIDSLFYSKEKITETEIGRRLGISQQAVHKKKMKVFHKIKRILKVWLYL